MNLESGASPASPILSAFTAGVPLPDIITRLNLSAEDLHTFLSTPGIPDRLQALRALARFDQELRTIQAQNEATEFLRSFLKGDSHKPEEKRRAATAILRGPGRSGCHGSTGSVPARRDAASSPAKPDIADWSPSDSSPDDEDDADLDEDPEDAEDAASAHAHPRPASAERGVGGPSESKSTTESPGAPGVPVPASKPAPRPQDLPKPALDITPDQLVAHQLAVIQTLDKPILTPNDIYAAIDYHNLSFYNRYYAGEANAFKKALIDNAILNLPGSQVTAEPAVIHNTTPPTATVRVTIKRPPVPLTCCSEQVSAPDARCPVPDASCLFHLIHESTYFPDPTSPHAWHTQSITRDDSG